METKTGIEKAVDAVGSQQRLADLLGCTQQAVSEMVRRGYAPSERVVEIEALTGVPRKELVNPRLLSLLDADNF